jgi:hypothetical protein
LVNVPQCNCVPKVTREKREDRVHFLLAVEKAVLGANGGNARADTRKACLLLAPFRTPTGCLRALPKAQPKIGADLTRN